MTAVRGNERAAANYNVLSLDYVSPRQLSALLPTLCRYCLQENFEVIVLLKD